MAQIRYVNICALVLVVCASLAWGSQPLRCTVCRAARHLSYCDESDVCDAATQVCYVEKVINNAGVTHVNAGCKNKTECDGTGCFGESQGGSRLAGRVRRAAGESQSQSQSESRLCHHCCDTDFCNMYGCHDTFDLESLQGKRCFSCQLVKELEHCKTTVNCEADEVCYVQQVALGKDRWYSSGCAKNKMCDLLSHVQQNQVTRRKKRQAVPLWSDCCMNHMCNGHQTMDSTPPSRDSTNYQCPAMQAPAIVTSQPNKTDEMQCYTCHHVDSLDECVEKEYCAKDEICYMEMAASRTNKVFTLGCENKGMCDILKQAHMLEGEKRRKKRSYTPLWTDCCDGNLCNKMLETRLETTVATTTTLAPPPCEDEYSNCHLYNHAYLCEGSNEAWARINCRRYCAYCGEPQTTQTTTPSTTTTSTEAPTTTTQTTATQTTTEPTPPVPAVDGCADKFANCAMYTHDYLCTTANEEWSRVNCAKTCRFCVEPTTTTAPPLTGECKNKYTNCGLYTTEYICEAENEPWARKNCAAYCGYCHDESNGTL